MPPCYMAPAMGRACRGDRTVRSHRRQPMTRRHRQSGIAFRWRGFLVLVVLSTVLCVLSVSLAQEPSSKPAPGGGGKKRASTSSSAPAEPAQFGSPYGRALIPLGRGLDLRLSLIPPGEFMMGWRRPASRKVRITRPFYIGVYPVTYSQHKRVTGKYPISIEEAWKRGGRATAYPDLGSYYGFTMRHPVEVNWFESGKFCEKLSSRTGCKVRLPTEAEWEYACRAGIQATYIWGDDRKLSARYSWDISEVNKYNRDHGTTWRAFPVGTKEPNRWGIYDYITARQWCSDWWEPNPSDVPQVDPQGPPSSKTGRRVFRGDPVLAGDPPRLSGAPDWAMGGLRVVVEAPLPPPPQMFECVFRFDEIKKGKHQDELSSIVHFTAAGDVIWRGDMTARDGAPLSVVNEVDGKRVVPEGSKPDIRPAKAGAKVQLAIPNKFEAEEKDLPAPEDELFAPFKDARKGDLLRVKFRQNSPKVMGEVLAVEPYQMIPGEDQPDVYVFLRKTQMTLNGRQRTAVVLSKFLAETTLTVTDERLQAQIDKLQTGRCYKIKSSEGFLRAIEAYVPAAIAAQQS